jgi:hypothetical protein
MPQGKGINEEPHLRKEPAATAAFICCELLNAAESFLVIRWRHRVAMESLSAHLSLRAYSLNTVGSDQPVPQTILRSTKRTLGISMVIHYCRQELFSGTCCRTHHRIRLGGRAALRTMLACTPYDHFSGTNARPGYVQERGGSASGSGDAWRDLNN